MHGLLFVTALTLFATAQKTCYLRSGIADGPASQPCDPDADNSHCCQQGVHLCLSNKLCLDVQVNHVIEGVSQALLP